MMKPRVWTTGFGVILLAGTTCLADAGHGPAQPSPAPVLAAESVAGLEATLLQAAPTVRPEALHAALQSWEALKAHGEAMRSVLTLIDYGLPSTARRLWVFDLAAHKLLFNELVAHGRGSGEDLAEVFSNQEGSLMSSLGAFLTESTYNGKNGYSLKLRGMDPGINDQAESRTIVMHGAPYVTESFAHKVGRLGRSHGCPAVSPAIARPLIDEIKDQSLLYAWHPSLSPTLSALSSPSR